MSSDSTAANSVGDKVKGAWNVVHGAGEGIRGNANALFDDVGEQVAGRGSTDAAQPAQRTEGGERPAHVAARGADEIQAGMDKIHRSA
ncbi:hypothetical protein Q5752_005047 [Cryptotrichosporon argae]